LPASHDRVVVIGVDTHADVHVAAAVDRLGRTLATTSIPTTDTGYAELLAWAYQVGTPQCFGVERTGAWGAGLARLSRPQLVARAAGPRTRGVLRAAPDPGNARAGRRSRAASARHPGHGGGD
jgi:hypothetical protein